VREVRPTAAALGASVRPGQVEAMLKHTEIDRLADQLVELDLIREDNRGPPHLSAEDVLRDA
jgi:hypothetical protein